MNNIGGIYKYFLCDESGWKNFEKMLDKANQGTYCLNNNKEWDSFVSCFNKVIDKDRNSSYSEQFIRYSFRRPRIEPANLNKSSPQKCLSCSNMIDWITSEIEISDNGGEHFEKYEFYCNSCDLENRLENKGTLVSNKKIWKNHKQYDELYWSKQKEKLNNATEEWTEYVNYDDDNKYSDGSDSSISLWYYVRKPKDKPEKIREHDERSCLSCSKLVNWVTQFEKENKLSFYCPDCNLEFQIKESFYFSQGH